MSCAGFDDSNGSRAHDIAVGIKSKVIVCVFTEQGHPSNERRRHTQTSRVLLWSFTRLKLYLLFSVFVPSVITATPEPVASLKQSQTRYDTRRAECFGHFCRGLGIHMVEKHGITTFQPDSRDKSQRRRCHHGHTITCDRVSYKVNVAYSREDTTTANVLSLVHWIAQPRAHVEPVHSKRLSTGSKLDTLRFTVDTPIFLLLRPIAGR